MRSYLHQFTWKIIDLLFPPRCSGCGEWGTRWCENCQSQVIEITEPMCPSCGEPQHDDRPAEVCKRCQQFPPQYTAIRSWAVFKEPLQNAIHSLKYKNDLGIGEYMSQNLCQVFSDTNWNVDLVVPVPLGVERLGERGYNQAMLLARPFAWRVGLRHKPRSLKRIRETQSQVNLSLADRRENVAGAFQAEPEIVSGKSVVVVDDVTTSGSTLDACAAALTDAGARSVYGLTLARAVRSLKA
ncbi:MAG: Orotate phosphoribosyltransferase [Chloroflexi bacterium]|nr:Orotate phosphoribosyltransferase [Chloroflexota bacterium]